MTVAQQTPTKFNQKLLLLSAVMAKTAVSQAEHINLVLKMACSLMQMETGIVSRIIDNTYIIKHLTSTDSGLQNGHEMSLGDTFCSLTNQSREIVAIDHVSNSPYYDHNCFAKFKKEAYIGAPVYMRGVSYGTLSFMRSVPRDVPFSDEDKQLVELIAHWVGNTIEHNDHLQLLEAKESTLNEIQAFTKTGRWTWDVSTGTMSWDAAIYEMLGLESMHAPTKERWIASIHPEDRLRCENYLRTTFRSSDENFSLAYRTLHSDGSTHHILAKGNITRNDNGHATQIIGISQEVTDWHSGSSNGYLQGLQLDIINSLPLGVFVKKIGEEDHFLLWNDNLVTMLRMPRREALGKSVRSIFHEAFAEKLTQTIQDALITDSLTTLEEVMVLSDKVSFMARITIHPIKIDSNQSDHVIGTIEDITARVGLEEKLDIWTKAMEASLSPISIANLREPDQPLIYVNPAFEEMTGYSVDEVIGKNCRFLQGDERNQEAVADIRHALQTGESTTVVLRNYRKDGTLFWNELRLSPITDGSGEVTHFVGIQKDITHTKTIEDVNAKRARDITTAARVAEVASDVQEDTLRMLEKVTDTIKEESDIYHAHIYLLNETGDSLYLVAGSGDVGRKMVTEGRVIHLDQTRSIVARVARLRRGVMVNDTSRDTGFLPHPLLADTKSELAVPILAHGQLLGVLDIQSDKIDYFDEEDATFKQMLGTLIGISLQNAETLEDSEQAVVELNQLMQRLTRENWENFSSTANIDGLGYAFDLKSVQSLQNGDIRLMENKPERGVLRAIELQGTVLGEVAIEEPKFLVDEADQILDEILERLTIHLENLRLSEQTQVALSETETLYTASSSFNQATQLSDVLDVVVEVISYLYPLRTQLWLFDKDGAAQQRLNYAVGWHREDGPLDVSDEQVAALNNFIFSPVWNQSKRESLFFSSLADERLEQLPDLRDQIERDGAQAAGFIPLRLGQRLIALIAVEWDEAQSFSDSDRRIFDTLSAQAATSVDGILLLKETQDRAQQLATLTLIETDLSRATTEEGILTAVAQHTANRALKQVHLSYFDVDADGTPISSTTVAIWRNNQIIQDNPLLNQPLDIKEDITASLWLEHPHELIAIEDVKTDSRLSRPIQRALLKQNIRSMLMVPLHSGGRWRGILVYSWREKQGLSNDDVFIYRQMIEPAAATVASRRASLSQQEIQRETEKLYQASQRINRASGDYAEITATLGATSDSEELNRVVLLLYTFFENGELEKGTVVANWYRGHGPEPTPPGVDYPTAVTGTVEEFTKREPTFFEDTHDMHLDSFLRNVMERQEMRSMAVLPLWVGNRQLGIVLVQGYDRHEFTEQEKRLYNALLPQVAVAVESQNLFDAARKRAERERILREITEKVRSSTNVDNVMQTAVAEIGRVLGRKTFVYLNGQEINFNPSEGGDS